MHALRGPGGPGVTMLVYNADALGLGPFESLTTHWLGIPWSLVEMLCNCQRPLKRIHSVPPAIRIDPTQRCQTCNTNL